MCGRPMLEEGMVATWASLRGAGRLGPRVYLHIRCATPENVEALRRAFRTGIALESAVPRKV